MALQSLIPPGICNQNRAFTELACRYSGECRAEQSKHVEGASLASAVTHPQVRT